jgi:hypothetical protein
MKASDLKRLKELEAEKAKLKRIFACLRDVRLAQLLTVGFFSHDHRLCPRWHPILTCNLMPDLWPAANRSFARKRSASSGATGAERVPAETLKG